jgi:uncharacterized protein YacL
MDCYIFGLSGLALLGGSIATLTVSKEQHNILRNVFSDKLDKKYENISNERRNHYIIGLVMGIIISLIVVKNVSIVNYFKRVMLFLTITFATAIIFYSIMPKSDYMLNYLKTPEEISKWLDVYKTMKTRYFMGFILGLLAAIPISHISCN